MARLATASAFVNPPSPWTELLFGGERLRLLPQRVAWLPEHDVLLVADAHLGKAASFRSLGVPVPEATTAGTLARLDAALDATGASGVAFLGDLLHSAQGRAAATLDAVQAWRERHAALQLWLVRGNHDARAGDPPPAWRVHALDEPWRLGRLHLRHHPDGAEPGVPVVAGHVHPGAVLGGRAHERLRLPCFHLRGHCLLLPAFGEFTGLQVLPQQPGDRVFVVADACVAERPQRPA